MQLFELNVTWSKEDENLSLGTDHRENIILVVGSLENA